MSTTNQKGESDVMKQLGPLTGRAIGKMEMKKVLSFTSPPMPKDLLDKLISTVIQEEGRERLLEWALNDDGTLDLFTE